MISTDSVFLITTAVVYALTAGFIAEHARKRKLSVLYTFPIYFLSMAVYFSMSGIQVYLDNPLVTIASLFVLTFASATLIRFPFQLETPKLSKIIYPILLAVALAGITYSLAMLTLQIAVNIALFYAIGAPIIVGLYMIIAGLYASNIRGKSISLGILALASSLPFAATLLVPD